MVTHTEKPKIRKLSRLASAQAVLPQTTTKPFWRKITVAQTMTLVVLAVAIVLFMDLGRRAAANYRVQRDADDLMQQVELARQHRTELLARRSYVASDLFVEEVARKELKWAKAGETVVVVMPEHEAIALPANVNLPAREVPAETQPPAKTWWDVWFGQTAAEKPLD